MSPRRLALQLLAATALVVGCTSGSGATSTTVVGTTSPDSTGTDASSGAGTTVPAPSTIAPAATGVDWAPCDDPIVSDATLDCATVTVPLDYADPSSDTIDIAMVRVPATGDRQGAVLFNPGGPGASGFDYVAQGGTTLSTELGLANFDLIGFDPRGIDRSNGIVCLTNQQQNDTVYLDTTPDTPDEQAALDASSKLFETECTAKYGDTLGLYSTDNTARDIDAIRIALGDDQISYLGVSYGTYLGATYATMFPDHVRAMVLDSAFEPVGDTLEQSYTTQLVGFEKAFHNWAAWCQGDSTCDFQSDDVEGAWDALLAKLDTNPVAATDGRLANQAVMKTATISAMYSDTEWPVLASGLKAVDAGDPSTLFRLADTYVGRNDDGTFSTLKQSGRVIRCASGLSAAVPDDPAALAAHLLDLAPRFARGVKADDFKDSCAPLMPAVDPQTLTYSGAAPIVVVGGTNDPATPFRWAEEMAADMGDTARLVTFTGEGHGFVLASTCVTQIEAAVLVDLQVPDKDTVCDPDPDVAKPLWWDSLPVPTGIGDAVGSPEVAAFLGLSPSVAYSETRSASLSQADVITAYDTAMEGIGFTIAGHQQPIDGIDQAVYLSPTGEVFSVLAIGPDSFALPALAGLDQLVDTTTTLVVLLHLPQ